MFQDKQENKKHSPLLWITSLFAAEEIPSAMVTFVSLLMFIQLGVSHSLATIFSGLLFLPWVLKSFMRSKIRKAGNFKRNIHYVEICIFICLTLTAIYINGLTSNAFGLFSCMFSIAFFCAWHELLARMYYERMLYPKQQKIYNKVKVFVSQTTMTMTYGVLIIIVGLLEIFFRDIGKAWAMENYLVAGVFLVLMVINIMTLHSPRIYNRYVYESVLDTVKAEIRIIDRIRQQPYITHTVVSLFFLLIPQALMFNTRVFFLLASVDDGGLNCSLQDVGFAQGTIGVIAFSTGIAIGRRAIRKAGEANMFWPMAITLTLSPFIYMAMAFYPPIDNMPVLCCATFSAQIMFGFGLNVCMPFVRHISGERYRNTVNYLYIPLVASTMLIPMSLSGWIETELGFSTFFTVNSLCAPLAWGILKIWNMKKILTTI